MISGDPQLSAGFQDTRDIIKRPQLDEPPLVVAELWPGIRKKHENHRQAGIGQSLEDLTRIIRTNPHIRQPMFTHPRQQLGDAVLERLAADEAGVGMNFRLRRQVLATAEPDLERIVRHAGEQGIEVDGSVGQSKTRQQVADEPLLQRTERSALAPAVKFAAPPCVTRQANRLFSCATRSVRSQENPPSASAARPK